MCIVRVAAYNIRFQLFSCKLANIIGRPKSFVYDQPQETEIGIKQIIPFRQELYKNRDFFSTAIRQSQMINRRSWQRNRIFKPASPVLDNLHLSIPKMSQCQHHPLFLFVTLSVSLLFQQSSDGKVMMEYIGATGASVTFDPVPVQEGIDFYFILCFAIDADPSGNAQNGKFSPYWAETLTPDSVAAIKARHSNVKVVASFTGWSLGDRVMRWYDPTDPHLWISNAFSSLKSLAKTCYLDGIVIDYENFPKRHNSTAFAFCIGELITILKDQNVISIATIAPYHLTAVPYIELFKSYSNVIDYVNHQFYPDKVLTPLRYLEDFRTRASQFDRNKLLPSYEVNGRGIHGDAFFEILSLLERNGFEVNSVMIFSADASAAAANNYCYKRKSQHFLLNASRA